MGEQTRRTDALFGERVRAERVQLGLRQEDLAVRMAADGVPLHPSAISKIEAGTRAVRLAEAVAIADSLGVPIADLLNEPVLIAPEWVRGFNACAERVRRALDSHGGHQ